MIWKLMSVFDNGTEAYSPPVCVRAIGQAVREFTSQVRDPKGRIAMAPADFSLFELGVFDDNTGVIEMLNAPRRVLSGHEVSSQDQDL